MTPARRPAKRIVGGVDFMLAIIAFILGGLFGFFLAALMATAARDDDCARCWARTMRNVQPKDYEE
jgi:purine-cytosine permease-like protein